MSDERALAFVECIIEIRAAAKFIEGKSEKLFEVIQQPCGEKDCECAQLREPIKAQVIALQQSITTFFNNFELINQKTESMQ